MTINRAKVDAVHVENAPETWAMFVDWGIGRQTKRDRQTDTLQVQKQGGCTPTTRPDLHRVVTQPEGISLNVGNCQSRQTQRRTEKGWDAWEPAVAAGSAMFIRCFISVSVCPVSSDYKNNWSLSGLPEFESQQGKHIRTCLRPT